MAEGFGISQRDRKAMAKALETAGLDKSKASEVLDALLADGHMLIDHSTYSDMWIGANTHGPPS